MPWVKAILENDRDRYELPIKWLMLDQIYIDYLIELRRQSSKDRELFLNYQKECGKNGNRDDAKLMKEFAGECLKEFRGIEYFMGELTGDNRKQLSEELAPYADYIYGLLYNYKAA